MIFGWTQSLVSSNSGFSIILWVRRISLWGHSTPACGWSCFFFCLPAVEDTCVDNSCVGGDCLVTLTKPYYRCSCSHPYKLPDCQQGECSSAGTDPTLWGAVVLSLCWLQVPSAWMMLGDPCSVWWVDHWWTPCWQEFWSSYKAKWGLSLIFSGDVNEAIVCPVELQCCSLIFTLTASSQCRPNPCKNGGICIRHRMRTKFTCKCPEPYRGRFCEIGKCCGRG